MNASTTSSAVITSAVLTPDGAVINRTTVVTAQMNGVVGVRSPWLQGCGVRSPWLQGCGYDINGYRVVGMISMVTGLWV